VGSSKNGGHGFMPHFHFTELRMAFPFAFYDFEVKDNTRDPWHPAGLLVDGYKKLWCCQQGPLAIIVPVLWLVVDTVAPSFVSPGTTCQDLMSWLAWVRAVATIGLYNYGVGNKGNWPLLSLLSAFGLTRLTILFGFGKGCRQQ
jgi:hypothetical protein